MIRCVLVAVATRSATVRGLAMTIIHSRRFCAMIVGIVLLELAIRLLPFIPATILTANANATRVLML